jgi:hypothetical protein
MTFTPGTVLTSAQLNVHLRDNLLASEASVVDAIDQYIVAGGYHSLEPRIVDAHYLGGGLETSSSTEWGDLEHAGPWVTVRTSTKAWVIITAGMKVTNLANAAILAGYEVTAPDLTLRPDLLGEGTSEEGEDSRDREPDNSRALIHDGLASNKGPRRSYVDFRDDLVPGYNTFTMKYRVDGSDAIGGWVNRSIIVIPL